MDLHLFESEIIPNSNIEITGSKSETNRMLLLQALYPQIALTNISHSDDSNVMITALNSDSDQIDIYHAGTAMRFLTAYFAIQVGRTVVLAGSKRMKERPIKILVEALRQIGAQIDYLENEGFPPLKITGKKLALNKVKLNATVSSQYISALLLIAPKLEQGLEITLDGEITSIPYIKMTLALLDEVGIENTFQSNIIAVASKSSIDHRNLSIESDWSSASYFYSIVALAKTGTQITLSTFKENSFQGDSALVEIFKQLGVETSFQDQTITLTKSDFNPSHFNGQLNDTPDIAQTIAVTCFGLGISCQLMGLQTLKIKETDRLEALKTELSKLGAQVIVTNDSLTLEPSATINANTKIKTYDDHRMAMAFAPLALKTGIVIENSEVVSKSFPTFWNDLQQIGFQIK